MTSRRARFVVLDGVDGCGKTTQAERLVAAWTLVDAPPPLHLREPGSTRLGERLRAILLDSDVEAGSASETLLFAAARRQTLDELVAPALAAGRDVVCERFHASTYAYQAFAGELPTDEVLALLHGWANDPAPDCVLLLELDDATARERRGPDADRIESRGASYLERVAEGYRDYAARFPERVRVVDATGSADEVARRVLAVIEEVPA